MKPVGKVYHVERKGEVMISVAYLPHDFLQFSPGQSAASMLVLVENKVNIMHFEILDLRNEFMFDLTLEEQREFLVWHERVITRGGRNLETWY